MLKLYPSRLHIAVTEREAFALWQKDGKVSVIAGDGTVVEPFVSARFAKLPLVVGIGAETKAKDFLALLDKYPLLREQMHAAVLVAERRWNVVLKNGIDVRLPETDVEKALDTLVQLDRDNKLLSRDITAVDLRLADRVTVRLSDERRGGAHRSDQGQEQEEGRRCLSLHDGFTPKMKPVSPRRSAIVAALDIGTSKIVCLIARLKPQSPQDVLRRRSHGIEILGVGHTEARGMKGGAVINLAEAEEAVRHAVDLAERDASVQLESVVLSVSSGRPSSEFYAVNVNVAGSSVTDGDIARVLGGRLPSFGARRPRRAAFAADRLCARRRARRPRAARHAGARIRRRHACGDRRRGGGAQPDAGGRALPSRRSRPWSPRPMWPAFR